MDFTFRLAISIPLGLLIAFCIFHPQVGSSANLVWFWLLLKAYPVSCLWSWTPSTRLHSPSLWPYRASSLFQSIGAGSSANWFLDCKLITGWKITYSYTIHKVQCYKIIMIHKTPILVAELLYIWLILSVGLFQVFGNSLCRSFPSNFKCHLSNIIHKIYHALCFINNASFVFLYFCTLALFYSS